MTVRPTKPGWMLEFKAKHGIWPIAGGSTGEAPAPTNNEGTVPPSGEQAPQPRPGLQAVPTTDPASGFPDVQQQQVTHHSASQPRNDEGKFDGPPQGYFTPEQVEKFRQEEKDKLYPQIEKMREELDVLRQEREARLKAEEEAQRQAEEEAERKRKEEMDFKSLLEETNQTWEQKFVEMQREREAERAALDKERELASLMEYRARRLAEEGDEIIPQLRDMVIGNTPEEIDASIASLKERSSAIFNDVAQAQVGLRAAQKGVPVTAPPVGPVEQNEQGYKTFTADDIRNMDMATYIRNRDTLLRGASQSQNQGLMG